MKQSIITSSLFAAGLAIAFAIGGNSPRSLLIYVLGVGVGYGMTAWRVWRISKR